MLWWAIPLGIVAWSIVAWRPAVWTWPVIAALLSLSRFMIPLIVGNTDLWVWAAIALGLRWGWPSLLVAVKPSLFRLHVHRRPIARALVGRRGA